jgi:hypothetical protein
MNVLRLSLLVSLSALFVACSPNPEKTDEDGDGVMAVDDCDDTDPNVSPDAAEVCDGLDNDCNGEVDDGVLIASFIDADGDGHGNADYPAEGCEVEAGYVENSDDCDDGDDQNFPGNTEICDAQDNDCDDAVDDADDDVDTSTGITVYQDRDDDGFGDPGSSDQVCAAEAGWVDNDGDCDDANEWVHPDAVELCNGVDDDCNAATGEDDTVTFVSSAGPEDVTGSISGGAEFTEPGDLVFCDGTFDANLVLSADVNVIGFSGDAASVVLDGGGSDRVASVTGEIDVSFEHVTLTNGGGANWDLAGSNVGGALWCEGASLLLSDVAIEGNTAGSGSAMTTFGCDTTLQDVVASANTSEGTGPFWLIDGTHDWDDVQIHGNTGTVTGGLHALGYVETVQIDANNVDIYDNTSEQFEAALETTDLFWTGGGITSGAALGLYIGGSTYSGDTVDFGTEANSDDNAIADVYVAPTDGGYLLYRADDDVSFDCDADGCGDLDTAEMGNTNRGSDQDNYTKGNVFLASEVATLDSFDMNLVPESSCLVDFTVSQATSLSTDSGNWDWEVVWFKSDVVPTTGEVGSGAVGILLEPGMYYATTTSFRCSTSGEQVAYYYEIDLPAAAFGHLSTTGHSITTSGYDGTWTEGDTVTLSTQIVELQYDMNVYTTQLQ